MKSLHDWTIGNVIAAWLIYLAAITVIPVWVFFTGPHLVKGPVALRIPLRWTWSLFAPPFLLTLLWLWRRARP